MGKYTYKTAWLVLAALLLPISVWAAGLGKLTVLSSLGQPLKAEIEIVSLQAGEAEELSARLAPQEAFRQANIELPSALFSLKFAIERRAEGPRVITISSTEPMNEPFIDMLVELNWSAGKLVREYTFLLDPPEYKGLAVAAAPAAPAAVAPAAESIPVPAPTPPEARAPMRAEEAPPAAAAATYEVKRGDTLSGIAKRNVAAGATLSQMLVALYRGNREAFDGDNMNRLRAGRILNLSAAETAAGVSAEEAQRLIATQNADFSEYRRKLASAVAAAPASADAGRQVAGKIGAPEAEKPVAAPAPTKDQLRLAKAGDATAGGRAGAAARGDDLAAKEKALKEANERIALLEKNVADLQKLAQLRSEAGAQLQQAAKAQAAAKAEVAKEAAPAKAEPAPAAKAPVAATAAPDAAKSATDAAKAATDATKAVPKAAPKAVVVPPPPPPPSFVDELLENEIALGGAGGVIVLLAGYAVYAWQKKRKEQAEGSLLGSAGAGASSAFGASGGRQVDTAASGSFQSDFNHEGMGKIDTEEIDPVAEADVYMAYGRDAQAEEILKEALAKDPGRQAARVKLLEVYANRKDRRAFEATATELYAATNGQGPEWGKAASLGMTIDPENPLYGGGAAAAPDVEATAILGAAAAMATQAPAAAGAAAQAAAPPASALDFDLDLSAAAAPAAPAAAEFAAPAQAGGGLDFDLDLGAPAAAAAPAESAVTAQVETTAGLDFDLDIGGEAKPAETAPEGVAAKAAPGAEPAKAAEGANAQAPDELAIDFDISAEVSAPAEKQEVQVAAAAESGGGLDFDIGLPSETSEAAKKEPALDSISLDLGESAGSGAPAVDAHWQEVATKLDLAKAYEEMGDRDGSRELLNEVIAEGDAAQQQQAKTMLEALG